VLEQGAVEELAEVFAFSSERKSMRTMFCSRRRFSKHVMRCFILMVTAFRFSCWLFGRAARSLAPAG
jgi:hypothetical protein